MSNKLEKLVQDKILDQSKEVFGKDLPALWNDATKMVVCIDKQTGKSHKRTFASGATNQYLTSLAATYPCFSDAVSKLQTTWQGRSAAKRNTDDVAACIVCLAQAVPANDRKAVVSVAAANIS